MIKLHTVGYWMMSVACSTATIMFVQSHSAKVEAHEVHEHTQPEKKIVSRTTPHFRIICLDGRQYWFARYGHQGMLAPRNDEWGNKQLSCQGHEVYVKWDGLTDHEHKGPIE